MELTEKERKALQILADESDSDAEIRRNGMLKRTFGAKMGEYLNNPIYVLARLERKGLVSKLGERVILTRDGYNCVRPAYRRALDFLKGHPIVTIISIVVTVIAILVTLLR